MDRQRRKISRPIYTEARKHGEYYFLPLYLSAYVRIMLSYNIPFKNGGNVSWYGIIKP